MPAQILFGLLFEVFDVRHRRNRAQSTPESRIRSAPNRRYSCARSDVTKADVSRGRGPNNGMPAPNSTGTRVITNRSMSPAARNLSRGGGTRRLRERKLGANRFHGPLSQLRTDTLKNSHARSAQHEEDSHSLRNLLGWPFTEGLRMIWPGVVDISRPMMVRYSVIYRVTR
jgi:hypothetical protein